tara:strand:- start:3347 stop:3577 length:231 start_codon:yes stop_codon:yes gene_type:complete
MAACDPVNHPSHYASGGIECITAMEASMSPEEFQGYLRGNIFKYCWRFRNKNGVQDLQKARWYIDMLIKTHETSDD